MLSACRIGEPKGIIIIKKSGLFVLFQTDRLQGRKLGGFTGSLGRQPASTERYEHMNKYTFRTALAKNCGITREVPSWWVSAGIHAAL